MDRIQELERSIRRYWDERTETKRRFLLGHYKEMKPGFDIKLMEMKKEQAQKRSGGEGKKISSIYLVRPMTSIYTESYEMILGMADRDLYLDEDRSEVYWYPELVYKDIDGDMREVEHFLKKRFVRLESYELFYLKKILLDDDQKLLQEVFLHLLEDTMDQLLDHALPLEDELQILSGDHMDELEVLRRVPIGGLA